MEVSSDYDFGEDSVVIASYPKTGTAWISYIILQILSNGKNFPDKDKILKEAVEFLEMTGEVNIIEKPKVYKTYLSYDKIKKHPGAKLIYVCRRPEDTFASYYNFLLQYNKSLDFERCFREFVSDNGIFDGFFDNVLSFMNRKDDNLLLISYESMHSNTADEILKIAKFLGEKYHKYIANDKALLNKIIEQTSFEGNKCQLDDLTSSSIASNDDAQFPKKGIIGGGHKLLNNDQLKFLMKLTDGKLKGTEMFSEWTQK